MSLQCWLDAVLDQRTPSGPSAKLKPDAVKIDKFHTTIGQTVASVAIETGSAVAAEARGVVRAQCILGALLLEPGDVKGQIRRRAADFLNVITLEL